LNGKVGPEKVETMNSSVTGFTSDEFLVYDRSLVQDELPVSNNVNSAIPHRNEEPLIHILVHAIYLIKCSIDKFDYNFQQDIEQFQQTVYISLLCLKIFRKIMQN
jgi:hypothetical protein